MGRIHNDRERRATLEWAEQFRFRRIELEPTWTVGGLASVFEADLSRYFALCALARGKSAPASLSRAAHKNLFRVRVGMEKMIAQSILAAIGQEPSSFERLFEGWFYGSSKKQGVSVRLPLTTCLPTPLCSGGCYAHDVLDAAPRAVIRGSVNGVIAELYQAGLPTDRASILKALLPHSKRAVREALKEIERLSEWRRRPYIRFAHLGDAGDCPDFMNAIAQQIGEISAGGVDCVVYTRHSGAAELEPDLWVVNFTLDRASGERRGWIPPNARVVYSAWSGAVSEDADINFLEHHRWTHASPVGSGSICPATLPDTLDRSCDSVRCDRCFRRPVPEPMAHD